jgi:hypothetical protein
MKEIGLWGGQGTNPPPGPEKSDVVAYLCLCLIVSRCSRPNFCCGSPLLLWVKTGKAQRELITSAIPE